MATRLKRIKDWHLYKVNKALDTGKSYQYLDLSNPQEVELYEYNRSLNLKAAAKARSNYKA